MQRLKNKRGFTLIEIIVVIVILAVLMAVAVPSVMSYIGEANNAKYIAVARSAMVNAETQLSKKYIEQDEYENENKTVRGEDHPACTRAKQLTNHHSGSGTNSSDSVDVSTIRAYKANSSTPMKNGDNPEDIAVYVVWFANRSDNKVAIVTPNRKVEIVTRTEADAKYSK